MSGPAAQESTIATRRSVQAPTANRALPFISTAASVHRLPFSDGNSRKCCLAARMKASVTGPRSEPILPGSQVGSRCHERAARNRGATRWGAVVVSLQLRAGRDIARLRLAPKRGGCPAARVAATRLT